MPEHNNKSTESSAPTVLVVGRNKNVTDEEFDMRDKSKDHEAAEVWSILKMLMADEQKNSDKKPNRR